MFLVGVDIGGTKCAVVLGKAVRGSSGEKSIEIVSKTKFPTEPGNGPGFIIDRLMDATRDIISGNGLLPSQVACIGINCGGPLNSREGLILSPPNLIGWDRIPITDMFQKALGIRTRLQNDANAGALAEWMYGAGRGFSNIMFITFGTGFGAGLILDGRLYAGTSDTAGEIGHIRISDHGPVGFGKEGSLEGFCSGGGIAQLARTKVLERFQTGKPVSFCASMEDMEKIDAKMVGDAADAGDELAREVYRISGTYLGKGLSIFIDLINPQRIIIGSIFARSTHLLWPHAKEVIDRETLVHAREACEVVPAGLGEKIGDLAALSIAVYEMGGLS
ncbi:MAG: ROK family protein [Clostridia bacterium]